MTTWPGIYCKAAPKARQASLCDRKRILAAVPKQELKHGCDHQLKQLSKIATPEAFAAALDYAPSTVRVMACRAGIQLPRLKPGRKRRART